MLPHVLNKFKDIFEKNLTVVKKIKEKKWNIVFLHLFFTKPKKKKTQHHQKINHKCAVFIEFLHEESKTFPSLRPVPTLG